MTILYYISSYGGTRRKAVRRKVSPRVYVADRRHTCAVGWDISIREANGITI